jgi:cob(I)alamin adenosyltransferase
MTSPESAELRNGFIHAYYGTGRGKTSSAAGLALRALYHGYRVLFVQFLKTNRWKSGEVEMLKRFDGFVHIQAIYTHPLFYAREKKPSMAEVKKDQKRLLAETAEKSRGFDLVVLDEILNCLKMVGERTLMDFLARKRPDQDIVLTGRILPRSLAAQCGYVTEFKGKRHPYEKGVAARKGVEF